MGGLGIGEVLLIGLIVGFIVTVLLTGLFGIPGLKPGGRDGSDAELQKRTLEELDSLRLRVGALEDRLDRARIGGTGGGLADGEDGSEQDAKGKADHE